MPYEPKPGEIVLFENEKMGNDRAPDHRGYIVAHRDIKAGERIPIALWKGKADGVRSFGGVLADSAKPVIAPPDLDLFGNEIPKASSSRKLK